MNKKTKSIKNRVTWGFNPISRVKLSKKIYSRKKTKSLLSKEI